MAAKKVVDLKTLSSEAFILYLRAVRPGLADAVVTACEKAVYTES